MNCFFSRVLGSANIENAVARRQELKSAALQAKRAGDQATALHFVRLVKVYYCIFILERR